MRLTVRLFLVAVFYAWQSASAFADPTSFDAATPNLYGSLGLNTIPSARMDEQGTVRASLSAADPYVHTQVGYQVTNRFYFGLRQSSEISNLRDDPDKVFPGLDLKYKLIEEDKLHPAVAIGLQSAFGDKRMAAEYLTFSKRYENFDFTAGLGWGRFGTRHKIRNPFIWADSGHRQIDGDKPNGPKDWFKGDAGVFAGLEYATPWKGLTLKADISSDSYTIEHANGQDGPSGYSLGLSYQPADWVDIGVAWMDRDTVMARISFKSLLSKWAFKPSDQNYPVALKPDWDKRNIVATGKENGFRIRNVHRNGSIMSGQIDLTNTQSTPYQLGQVWRIITNKSPRENPDVLKLEPAYFGLKAPAISIDKRDLVNAANHQGSSEEIWHNASFDENFSGKRNNIDKYFPNFTLRENFSVSEDDSPFLHRTDLIATISHQMATNFIAENSFRYNLFSNIDHLNQTRMPVADPQRSDIANYLVKPFAIERAFVQGFKSFSTDWHATAGFGALEEMFAGYHGEILYRPWGKNWAAGIEAANVVKRDYETPLNVGHLGESLITGHANFYYEVPDSYMTIHASVGQYIAQDKGGTISLKNRFANGSTVEAFVTATNMSDPDPYGASSAISSGLRFTLPLGSLKYIPEGSGIEVNAMPLGRDAGQQLDLAHRLYDMTEPLSYRHLTQYWGDVTN